MEKVTRNIYVNRENWDQFIMMATYLEDSASQVIDEFIRDWVITHKAEFNEKQIDFWSK